MAGGYWKRVATKVLLTHARIQIVEDEVVLPDGYKTAYLRFEKLQDWVTLLAIKGDMVAFIKDYSYPLDKWLWQLPEGLVDRGETIEQTASRELREECGLEAASLRLIGMNYGDHRRSTRKNFIFVAEDLRDIQKSPGDPEEQGMERHWFTLDEVKHMIVNGEIVQKHALSALATYWAQPDGS
ncbi:NUDIX hydrolase [Candidatus Saccharibacteria bacterium]|nr:NUDIX hydrolase [Candidatus Saccharibacteria bacterium]